MPGKPKYLQWIDPESRRTWALFINKSVKSYKTSTIEDSAQDFLGEDNIQDNQPEWNSVIIAASENGVVGVWIPAGHTIGRKLTGDLAPLTPFDFSQTQPLYEDVQFPIASGKVPAANYPDWDPFTTNTAAYSFEVDDYIDLQADELPHKWKEGTNGHIHVHFALAAAQATGANRYVKLQVVVAKADTGDVWAETPYSAESTIPTGSSDRQAFYLDIDDVDLSSNTIGCQIKARVKRIAATGGTEFAGEVFITQVGMHVQLDSLGSRQELVK